MAGKAHIEKSFRMLVDDSAGTPRDLSADIVPGSVQGGGIVYDQLDASGISEGVRSYLAGMGDAPISCRFYMNNTPTTGAFTVINAINGDNDGGTLTMQWGEKGNAPTAGDPEFEGEYVAFMQAVDFQNQIAGFNCEFKKVQGAADPAWGTV